MNLIHAVLAALFGAVFTAQPKKNVPVLPTRDEIRDRRLAEGDPPEVANWAADNWANTTLKYYYPNGHPNEKR